MVKAEQILEILRAQYQTGMEGLTPTKAREFSRYTRFPELESMEMDDFLTQLGQGIDPLASFLPPPPGGMQEAMPQQGMMMQPEDEEAAFAEMLRGFGGI